MATDVTSETSRLTAADVEYIKSNFFRLEELCAGRRETPDDARRLIAGRILPSAAYVVGDGSEWFPADLFLLFDQAASSERVHREFARRIREAGGGDEDVESAWESYLAGEYAWCLLEATPENMMRKARLVDSIEALLDAPRPADADWQAQLRAAVWSLEAIERPFAPDYDRNGHLGTLPSFDRFVELPRERYPGAFAVD